MSDFTALWAEAIAVYERSTQRKVNSSHTFSQFDNLDDLFNAVSSDSVNLGDYRDRHKRVYKALTNAISPLLPVLQLVRAGMGNTPFAPLSNVLGASVFLFDACRKVSATFDAVEELFERIADVTKRVSQDNLQTMDASLKTKLVNVLALIMEILGVTEHVIRKGRFKIWARSVFLQDDQIRDALDKLQRYVDQEIDLRTTLTYRGVKDLQVATDNVTNDVGDVRSVVRQVLVEQRQDRQQAISDADNNLLAKHLYTSALDDFHRQHVRNLESLAKGTAYWLKDEALYQAWDEDRIPLLWVLGTPGVGKTMLAARTIDALHTRFPRQNTKSSTSVSYVYLSHDHVHQSTDLMKAMIAQIADVDLNFKCHVLNCVKRDKMCLMSARQIWTRLMLPYFTRAALDPSPKASTIIVIDGLDEIPEEERVKLVTCFTDLVRHHPTPQQYNVRVVIFCRPEVRADVGFDRLESSGPLHVIEVKSGRNSEDIKKYIKSRLLDVELLRALKQRKASREYQTLAKDIYQMIQNGAQGMFLWVKLVFDQIRKAPSPEAIRTGLQYAPSGLDQMLHHLFKRLSDEEQYHSHLKHILSWTYCAIQPLSMADLYFSIQFDFSQQYVMLAHDLKYRYSSLFNVDPWFDENLRLAGDTALHSTSDKGIEPPELQDEEENFDFLDDGDSNHKDFDPLEDSHEVGSAVRNIDASYATTSRQQGISFQMPSTWADSAIRFSHARISDYMNIEGNPVKRRFHDCSVVPADIQTFDLYATHFCIRLLTSPDASSIGGANFVSYADLYWTDHLRRIDLGRTCLSERLSFAQQLVDLFYDGIGLQKSARRNYRQFTGTWLYTDLHTITVRNILREVAKDIGAERRDWVHGAVGSARVLLKPFATACAKAWLVKNGWDDEGYCDGSPHHFKFCYYYSLIDDEGRYHRDRNRRNPQNPKLDSNTIMACANSFNLSKNEHWYARVGWTLLVIGDSDCTDLAISHFERAFEMDTHAWPALEGLARCYGDQKKEHEKAATIMQKACSCLPTSLKWLEHFLLTDTARWLSQVKGVDNLDIARQAFVTGRDGPAWDPFAASSRSIPKSIKLYFDALYEQEYYSEIADMFKDLSTTSTLWPNYSLLSIFLLCQKPAKSQVSNLYVKVSHISKICKDCDLIKLVVQSLKEAFQAPADINGWITLPVVDGSDFLRREGFKNELGEILNRVVTVLDKTSGRVVERNRDRAASIFGSLLLEKAVEAQSTGQDPSASIDRLRQLALRGAGHGQIYRACNPTLLLGKWLHEYAKEADMLWKSCFRSSIRADLSVLNSDALEDYLGVFAHMGQVLLFAGDRHNAAIALGLTVGPIKRQEVGREEREGENDADSADFVDDSISIALQTFQYRWLCDGPCERRLDDSFTELHFCDFCRDVCFCQDCIQLVRSDRMPYVCCSAEHKHLQVLPLTEAADRIVASAVEGNLEATQEWLKQIRKEWDVVEM